MATQIKTTTPEDYKDMQMGFALNKDGTTAERIAAVGGSYPDLMFDSMAAIGLTACSLQAKGGDIFDGDQFLAELLQVSFNGASGNFKLDDKGDRDRLGLLVCGRKL